MSRDFCFYHAADLHLDTPFSGLEQVAPEVAQALREASLEAFDALVAQAISDQAAFLLLAGDIYDGAQRGLRAQFRVQSGLQRLSEAGIPVLMVHGNHDPLDGWSGIRAWPPGVHVYGARDVEAVPIERDGERLATIYGISYASARVDENLARRYQRGNDPGLHIGLLHCNVEGNADHAAYAPCSLDDLRASGMDYWALGHVHARQILSRGNPWVVYPGNLQGRSPKPSERGAKGAYRIDVRGGVIGEPTFVPLDRVRFVGLELEVTALEDLSGLRAALIERTEALASEHAGRALLIRAWLRGRPGFQRDLLRPDTIPALLRELRDEFGRRRPFIWWEALRDETRAPLDRAALATGADFTAEVLKEVDRLAADPAALARFGAVCDEPLSRPGLQDLVSDADALETLLAEAETLALELLRN